MSYIYQITNLVNGKKYVGKTDYSIEERFKVHMADSKKGLENRPLYKAFEKYGIENFEISLLEETENDNEREIYYIEKMRTYVGFEDCNGYNATLGGEGRRIREKSDKEIIKAYSKNGSVKKTAEITSLHPETISRVLKSNNIEVLPSQQNHKFKDKQFQSKTVYLHSKPGDTKSFPTVTDAAEWVVKEGLAKASVNSARVSIGRAISGKRKTYLGFT